MGKSKRRRRAIAADLEASVAAAWERGWQPVDLHRFVQRRVGADAARLLREVMATEAATYADLGGRVARGWMAQLEDIGVVAERGDLAAVLDGAGTG